MQSDPPSIRRILFWPAIVWLSLGYHFAWAFGHLGRGNPMFTLLASILLAAAVSIYSIRRSVTATTRWPWYVAGFASLCTIPPFWNLLSDFANNI